MECRNILFVRLLCASCWSCFRWECSCWHKALGMLSEAKCTNTRREGWGERIWLWYRHTQALIYLSFPALSYLFIHISFISSGCIYISESEKERECYISEHAIYLYYLLIFPCLFCHLHHLLHLPEPFFYVGLDLGSAKFCSRSKKRNDAISVCYPANSNCIVTTLHCKNQICSCLES